VIGRTLSHYQILEHIASGGMGVVYRARDLRLKRDVALKVLLPETLANEKSRARFRREALALSRLSHANICTIFDFDSHDGTDFLVMELVGGAWLEDRIRSGPLSEVEILRISIEVVDALEAAHHEGVIHRDLKPANIGFTPDGHVKVLDFGLARSLLPASVDSTTESVDESRRVVGTVPYMAPEQLLGREVDARADLYSVGVILYRMAVGHLPFDETNPTALANQILHADPPPPIQVNPRISPRLQEIILRCLEKDPAFRYQTAVDLKADLNRRKRELESGTERSSGAGTSSRADADRRRRRRRMIATTLLVVVLAAGVMAAIKLASLLRPTPLPEAKYRQLTFVGSIVDPALSPDGASFAYVNRTPSLDRLMVQDIEGGAALEIFSAVRCMELRWAPDGSAILCAAVVDSILQTYLIPRLGGSRRAYSVVGAAQAWSPDGSKFVTVSRSQRRITVTDRTTGEGTSASLGSSFSAPIDVDWSPRGDRLALLTVDEDGMHSIWTLRPSGVEPRKIHEERTPIQGPRWSPRGDAVYFFRANGPTMDLYRVAVPSGSRSRPRSASIVLPGIQRGASLTLSRDGQRLLYACELERSNLWRLARSGGDRRGPAKATQLTSGTGYDSSPRLSPDGKSVAFVRGNRAPANLFVVPVTGGGEQQVTFSKALTAFPVWSPHGDELAFASNEGGPWRVWLTSVHGTRQRPFERSRPFVVPGGSASWSGPVLSIAWAPGARIVYQNVARASLSILDPVSGGESRFVHRGARGDVAWPAWSPDQRQLAYFRYTDPTHAGIHIYTVADSSYRAVQEDFVLPICWSSDGRYIYARGRGDANEQVVAIPTEGGAPRVLLDLPWQIGDMTVFPDGSGAITSVLTRQTDVWLVEDFERGKK
jgi:Tol biopolymer transport system component